MVWGVTKTNRMVVCGVSPQGVKKIPWFWFWGGNPQMSLQQEGKKQKPQANPKGGGLCLNRAQKNTQPKQHPQF